MFFLRFLGWLYFKSIGWTLTGNWPENTPRAIVLAAPHTSNQDYLIGVCGFWQRGLHPNILIKKESFKGLKGWFLRGMGAIPVDRGRAAHLIDDLATEINRRKKAKVVFTPEGTRKRAKRWKTGFYHTALKAGVPIVVVYTDYSRKDGGYGPAFYPTGDIAADFRAIREWFIEKDFKGKYPDQSSWDLWPPEEAPLGISVETPATTS